MGAAQCKQACDDFGCNIDATTTSSTGGDSSAVVPWYLDVEVDSDGCRVLQPLPPCGEHPRLLFTKAEIPSLVARHTHTSLQSILGSNLAESVRAFRRYHAAFSALSTKERKNPSRQTLDEFFTKDERRNEYFLSSYIHGFIASDNDLLFMVKEAVLFYAKVITAAACMARETMVEDRPYDIWHSTNWDMTTSFLFGGAAYALLYDLLFVSLSVTERETVRKAISLAISGRRAWGMGWPARRIQSNWAPYQGDLFVLAAAIEGEEGADKEVMNLYEDMMLHYTEFSIYDSGHPAEDAYCPNLAFREGSMTFLAMARRGFNLFKRSHFVDIWRKWMPYALESHADGSVYGGSSGSNFPFPTAAFIAKYMYPKDPVIDYAYRHYLRDHGIEYQRVRTSQTRWAANVFAYPSLYGSMSSAERDFHDATDLKLPLTFHCNDRGKVIMKSDWTQTALSFTLDARPDGFLIGHDTASRGAFVLNANGRRWADCPEWNLFKESSDFSLITIDGVGQLAKAPFVKLLGCIEGKLGSTFTSADLTYASNYTWSQWAKPQVDMSRDGWEHEPHDPRDFGMTAWWLPKKLYDEPNVGFTGLYQWRKRFNSVANVSRSALMVRDTDLPFVVMCDNAVKDRDEHEYAWCMTTPEDIVLESFDGRDAILGEKGDGCRLLLVRILESEGVEKVDCSLSPFSKPDPKRKLSDGSLVQISFGRLQFKYTAKEMQLKLGFFPLPSSSTKLPMTTWSKGREVLSVNSSTKIRFTSTSSKATTMEVLI